MQQSRQVFSPLFSSIQWQMSLEQASRNVLKSTCQLYTFKEGTKELPIPNGCGILIYINENYYCVSNAHVLSDGMLKNTFILLGGGKTMTLGGQYHYTALPPTGARKDDPLDIAIVHLQAEVVEALHARGYQFLPFSDVLTGHTLSKDDHLLVAGYPGSQTKINSKEKTVIAKPLFLRTSPDMTDLTAKWFSPNFHFCAKYAINKIMDPRNGKFKRGPKPHGISGSGLWLLKSSAPFQYKLVLIGIFSEYIDNRSVLISTKIDLFIDIIRQTVDCTVVNNGVKVNML